MGGSEMPAQETQELICIQCWQGFRLADARRLDDGTVVCPHCGSAQPGAEALESSEPAEPVAAVPGGEPAPPAQPEAVERAEPPPPPASPAEASAAPDEGELPPGALGSSPPTSAPDATGDAGEATGGESPEPPEDDIEALIEALDPQRATWRVKTGLGLSYTFYGIDAVIRWTQGKDISQAGIAPKGIDEWKSLDHFLRKLDRVDDARKAFLAAVPMGEEPPPDDDVWLRRHRRSRRQPELKAEPVELVGGPPTGGAAKGAKAKTAESSSSPASGETAAQAPPESSSAGKSGESAEAKASGERRKPTSSKPKTPARTTRRFEFRKPEPPPPKIGRAGPFLLGVLLGTLAGLGVGALALWYTGLLDKFFHTLGF